APFLPFVTEEVWSWWQDGSVHRAAWPEAGELREAAAGASPRWVPLAAEAIGAVRRAKSAAHLSMRAEVAALHVRAAEPVLADLEQVLDDVRAAGRVGEVVVDPTGGQDPAYEVRLTEGATAG